MMDEDPDLIVSKLLNKEIEGALILDSTKLEKYQSK